MLQGLTPEQFDELLAYESIETDTDALLERVIRVLIRGLWLVSLGWGAKFDPEDFDPDKEKTGSEAVVQVSPKQVGEALAAHAGR